MLLLGLCEAKGFGIYPVVEAATSTKRQATHRKMLTGVSECNTACQARVRVQESPTKLAVTTEFLDSLGHFSSI